MATPTPQDVASWPLPNYINPSTRAGMVLGIEIPFTVVTVLIVAARMVAPWFTKRTLAVEDWTMMVACVLTTVVGIINCTSVNTGFGYHLWDFKLEWTAPVGKVALIEQVLFLPIVCITKISILIFYQRIFPSRAFRNLSWLGIGFLGLLGVVGFFVSLFQCVPVYGYWEQQLLGRKCINQYAFLLAVAVINTLSDIYAVLLPLPFLARLRMPRKQRYGIMLLFSLGLIVCVAGILRIWYTTVYFKSYDIFYNGAILSVLAVVECNIGIICGCLPSVRQLVARLFPKLLDTSKNRTDTVAGSQNFPFQNLEAKNGCETNIVGGNTELNNSQESMLGADTRISRRDEVTVGYSTK